MTALIPRAKALARQLHAGQTDKRGRPYVEHLEAVVSILLRRWSDAPEEAVAAAWLHDALEDLDEDRAFIAFLEAGITPNIVNLVVDLTRPDDVDYRQYILGIGATGHPWAIHIKLADLEHNMDPSRAIPGSDIVERRYAPAQRVLEQALRQRGDIGITISEHDQ